jgi:hypothetical protein
VGTTLPENIRSVHVKMFENQSGEPDIEGEATSATVREFQREGTLSIAPEDKADSILTTRLLSYLLKPLRYSEDRATETQEYRLTLVARMILKSVETDEAIVHTTVKGEATFELIGDLAVDKRSALPAATTDLARRIVEQAVEAW